MGETKEPEQKIRTACIYRVFTNLCIQKTGQWIKASQKEPAIADLSDCEDASLRWLLDNGAIETADGEPVNIPLGDVVKRKPCPCGK